MTILYKFDQNGGFVVGDTETGLTSYAYPTSAAANRAKRDGGRVATSMMANEWPLDRHHPAIRVEAEAINRARLAFLCA